MFSFAILGLVSLVAVVFALWWFDRTLFHNVKGTVDYVTSIGALGESHGPAGPLTSGRLLHVVQGNLVLVAGTAAQVFTAEQAQGIPDGWEFIPFLKTPGGAPGWLRAAYVSATRTLTITSTNGGDTSTVGFVAYIPLPFP